jgi:hypothetical protein
MFKAVTVSRSAAAPLAAAMMIASTACGDGSKLVLNQQAEAHRLASHLHVQFTRAADASNRAVMADTDEASKTAAQEAEQAIQSAQRDAGALHTVLQDLGDRAELAQLDQFTTKFDEYRKLDADILPLAVENTNIKAQRLSFGPAQDAVSAFRQSIGSASQLASKQNAGIDALAAKAVAHLLEVQVIQARHIAESDEAAMTRMEAAMTASQTAARKALDTLKAELPPAAGPHLADAAAALDQFAMVNAEIVSLSRRNSNVRSLALSLGKKRTVTAECEDILQALEEALASHHFAATR